MINGEAILPRQEENFNSTNLSKKGSMVKRKKENKEMVGYKIQEFITLPARSRICVIVPAEGAEGVLNVKRL